MIPLYDEGVKRRRFPFVTVAIIVLNVMVFLYEVSLGDRVLQRFVLAYGVVPLEITTGRDLPPAGPPLLWLTLFTSMFMHGGWMHIGGNMLYLWVFGDNVEDSFGHAGYLAFYLAAGLAAAFAQILTDPASRVPSIGASGAIAGVLGAYVLLFPTARVVTLLVLGYFIRFVPLPALLVLGFWFVIQFFSGMASLGVPTGVAYWAHIGGFIAGLLLAIPLWLARRRRAQRYLP